jgi:hypothetical protein
MRLDVQAGGSDVTSLLDQFDASTSNVKGTIRLVKAGDLSKWMLFDVTSKTSPSGYRNFAVISRGSSSASPFANGDGLLLFFQRNGDIGTSAGSVVQLLEAKITSPAATLDFLNVFSAAYDRYQIELSGLRPSVAAQYLLTLAVAGVSQADVYGVVTGGGSSVGGATAAALAITVSTSILPAQGANYTIDIYNANATTMKTIGVRGQWRSTAGNYDTILGNGNCNIAQALSGFRLATNAGNFVDGAVRLYGFKNTP